MPVAPFLNVAHYEVLKALSVYRFLTIEQMQNITEAKSFDYIRKTVRSLEKEVSVYPLIDRIEGGMMPQLGRISDLYFLTKEGVEVLADADRIDANEINYPKNPKTFKNDYFHRIHTIDAHISLRKFCQRHSIEIETFDAYYMRKDGRDGERLSKVEMGDTFFIPDAIFTLRLPDGRRYAFALELYHGTDTKRVLHQLTKHAQAFAEGAISKRYDTQEIHQVVSVFASLPQPLPKVPGEKLTAQDRKKRARDLEAERSKRAQHAVMRRLHSEAVFEKVRGLMAFATLHDIEAHHNEGWRSLDWLDGSQRGILG